MTNAIVERIHEALQGVSDPELHRPLPELGMVQSVEFDNGIAAITILLTISGCPMKDRLQKDISDSLEPITEVKSLDLTFGVVNSHVGTMVEYKEGEPEIKAVYDSIVHSFQRTPVALFYVVANVLLGIHLFHGAWSIFQSFGLNNPRFNNWTRAFATGFASIVVIGNVSFPLSVMAGIVG